MTSGRLQVGREVAMVASWEETVAKAAMTEGAVN